MNKQPFKKGDKVERVSLPINMPLGTRAVVEEATTGGYLRLKGRPGWHDASNFKLVENETIVITTDGDVGTAKILKGKKLVKAVRLIRQKGDKHDLKALAAYAVQKLIPEDGYIIDVRKAGYTGAVCVVNSKDSIFTDGRILEFVGGACTNMPNAVWLCGKYGTLKDVKHWANSRGFDVVELHRR